MTRKKKSPYPTKGLETPRLKHPKAVLGKLDYGKKKRKR